MRNNVEVLKSHRRAMVAVLVIIDACSRALSDDQRADHGRRVALWQRGGAIAPRERQGALLCAFFSASYRC